MSTEVAPRAGAWIETVDGLLNWKRRKVAPRAGAWIETGGQIGSKVFAHVAPRAGAWIETGAIAAKNATTCRPPCGGVD